MCKVLKGDNHLVKHINNHIILNLIRTQVPISGADLAKHTGMTPSPVVKILRQLEKAHHD